MGHYETLRKRARRRLPRVAFDFVDGGADDEVTVRRNRTAFDDLALVPRVLAGVGEPSTDIELFGERLSMPVLLAPAGATLVAGPGAELTATRGAVAAGTVGFPGIDGASESRWIQMSLIRDRDSLNASIDTAQARGFTRLVVTVDTPVPGNRERDVRNGVTVPLRLLTPKIVLDAVRRPRWLWEYFASGDRLRKTFEQGVGGRIRNVQSHADYVRLALDPYQTWDDLHRLREQWDGPLLLKGVMCADDADLAVAAGCDGIVVSNHGGRQLDAVPASIEMLEEIVAAVDGRAEVLLDSGVRRGTDVVKALSLGAKACLVGRPWVFAVATDGAVGVTQMLDQLRTEIVRTLQLVGASHPSELEPAFVRRRPAFGWQRTETPISA